MDIPSYKFSVDITKPIPLSKREHVDLVFGTFVDVKTLTWSRQPVTKAPENGRAMSLDVLLQYHGQRPYYKINHNWIPPDGVGFMLHGAFEVSFPEYVVKCTHCQGRFIRSTSCVIRRSYYPCLVSLHHLNCDDQFVALSQKNFAKLQPVLKWHPDDEHSEIRERLFSSLLSCWYPSNGPPPSDFRDVIDIFLNAEI